MKDDKWDLETATAAYMCDYIMDFGTDGLSYYPGSIMPGSVVLKAQISIMPCMACQAQEGARPEQDRTVYPKSCCYQVQTPPTTWV